MQLKIKR